MFQHQEVTSYAGAQGLIMNYNVETFQRDMLQHHKRVAQADAHVLQGQELTVYALAQVP